MNGWIEIFSPHASANKRPSKHSFDDEWLKWYWYNQNKTLLSPITLSLRWLATISKDLEALSHNSKEEKSIELNIVSYLLSGFLLFW